jgi:hypothetical protein
MSRDYNNIAHPCQLVRPPQTLTPPAPASIHVWMDGIVAFRLPLHILPFCTTRFSSNWSESFGIVAFRAPPACLLVQTLEHLSFNDEPPLAQLPCRRYSFELLGLERRLQFQDLLTTESYSAA